MVGWLLLQQPLVELVDVLHMPCARRSVMRVPSIKSVRFVRSIESICGLVLERDYSIHKLVISTISSSIAMVLKAA